jgi:four helix bundle protein
MKRQTSKSKLQGNIKLQASRLKDTGASRYPEPRPSGFVLNDGPNGESNGRHPFDLEERTAVFGEAIVRFSKKIPRDRTNNRLIDQLVGAGTSVGANYCEASERQSMKDFRCAISRCVKEAKETKHFLRMIAASEKALVAEARELYREGNELHLILANIYHKTK